MTLWAVGLAIGLAVFWAGLIQTVGKQITKLNQLRAFSVALSAAITVIIASALWLPVSSTHIAIGWIFGVWLLKEFRKRLKGKNKSYIEKSMIRSIVLAWIITLPASWLIASITYITIHNFL
jgi:PiT family inorganic phosphate transporter